MPIIESSVFIKKPCNDLYRLLRSLEHYPSFLTHVEQLKVVSASNDTVLTEWCINVSGTPLRWKQLDIYDDSKSQIKFRMLEGDYGSYEGEWNLQAEGDSTRLSLTANLEWGLPQVSRYVDPFLRRKAELTIRSMLRAIKHRAELGDGFKPQIPIVSEVVQFNNRNGKRIIGFFDHRQAGFDSQPFIIMPPGYGETKRDALTAAYYLAMNGFNVLRYDATDHVGESEGEITTTTMSKLKTDLFSAIDFVESMYHAGKVGVIASSLAQRVALKAAAEDKRIAFLLGVVGVVNLRETLKAIYREDIIGDVADGKIKDTYDMLGFDIDKAYPITAIQDAYHDLESAIRDAQLLNIPLVFLVAEKDAWVKLDDVKLVLESSKQGELRIIPEAMHQIFENPRSAKTALKEMVVKATQHLRATTIHLSEVADPNIRELATQNHLERDRLRGTAQLTTQGERQFWEEYLGSYVMLTKVPDYRDYVSLIYRLLGISRRRHTILDAGCGVGYYGAWILSQIVTQNRPIPTGNHYIGLDFVESALHQASSMHKDIFHSLLKNAEKNGFSADVLSFQYTHADLNKPIPLADNLVDKICCSLVLSYVQDPLSTLNNLVRVMKPGARIVITSLKPYADLSEIYRNFVSQAENEQDIIEARRLLSSAGRIKQKEGEGHYHFFSERELLALMIAAGLERVKICRSFGNQANVAVAIKRPPGGLKR